MKSCSEIVTTTLEKQRIFDDTQEAQFEKRKQMYHTWVARAKYLAHEQQQLQEKNTFTNDLNNPSCPLCEQNLSAARKRFLSNKFSKLDRFYAHQYRRLVTILKQLKQLLVEQNKQREADQLLRKEIHTISTQQVERSKTTETIQTQIELYTKELTKPEKVLKLADKILYKAKRAGRNRVRI